MMCHLPETQVTFGDSRSMCVTDKEINMLRQISAQLNEPELPESVFRVYNAETGKIKMRLVVYHTCDDIKVIQRDSVTRKTGIEELRKLRKSHSVYIRQFHLWMSGYREYDYDSNMYL